MRGRLLALLAVPALLLAAPLPTAAASTDVALRCGMEIRKSVDLYLAKDLYCPTSSAATIIYQDSEEPTGPAPAVTIDLRGHILRGAHLEDGIVVSTSTNAVQLSIANGRLEDWSTAVNGFGQTRLTRVKMVDNRLGLACGQGCTVAESYFNRNQTGLGVPSESHAQVSGTTFSHNERAAAVSGYTSDLYVKRSVFARNTIGVEIASAFLGSSYNSYRGNAVAVRVTASDGESFGCASFSKDLFIDNATKTIGVTC